MRLLRFRVSFLFLSHAYVSALVPDEGQYLLPSYRHCPCDTNPEYLLSSAVRVGDITYYVPPNVIVTNFCRTVSGPATVFWVEPHNLPITNSWLNQKVTEFLDTDDVFNTHFLHTVVFIGRAMEGRPVVEEEYDIGDFFKQWNVRGYEIPYQVWEDDDLPEGPYFRTCEGMKQVWRIYEDTLDAFQVGVVPSVDGPNSFEPLPIAITSSTHLSIAVPSRLYSSPPTPEKPLSGLRIGVKDIIDLSGLPTSHQSRAYLALHGGPLAATAPAIQTLIEQGAVVVGKTRTTQFAAGEQASGDWIDFLPPWNPRGDGWQVPGMSSAGSASAVSGYEWIDGAVGSDTLGSMIGPAALQGLFGNRISTGVLDLDGVMPITERLDTLGFFARDIKVFNRVLKAWLPSTMPDESQGQRSLPQVLLYPTDYFPLSPPEVQAPISAFVEKLETFLHIRKREINFAEEWEKTAAFAGGVGITEYLKTVVSTLQLKGTWDNSRGFADEYKRVFGREMEVQPQVKYKWKVGAQITELQKEEAERKMDEYSKWVNEHFFMNGSCGGALLVLPMRGVGKPMYRNEYRGPPEEVNYIGMGWFEGLEPILAGLPVVVVPVGQFPYESRITERKEWLPVGLAVVAAKNCDLVLAEILEDFLGIENMGEVKTGKFAFDVEDMPETEEKKAQEEKIAIKDEL